MSVQICAAPRLRRDDDWLEGGSTAIEIGSMHWKLLGNTRSLLNLLGFLMLLLPRERHMAVAARSEHSTRAPKEESRTVPCLIEWWRLLLFFASIGFKLSRTTSFKGMTERVEEEEESYCPPLSLLSMYVCIIQYICIYILRQQQVYTLHSVVCVCIYVHTLYTL